MTTLRFKIEEEPRVPTPVARRPSRISRQLALAHKVEQLIDDGTIPSYSEAARRLGITRARMSQIVALLMLPLKSQEGILLGNIEGGERTFRRRSSGVVMGSTAGSVGVPDAPQAQE